VQRGRRATIAVGAVDLMTPPLMGDQSRRSMSISVSSRAASSRSAVQIEWCLFETTSQIGSRGAGVDRGGVEAFMAQQLRQLDQPARMLAQPGEREGVT
jgi:hypothetical protein